MPRNRLRWRRHGLWLVFLAVIAPLAILLVLQYRTLRRLQDVSQTAQTAVLDNYLGAIVSEARVERDGNLITGGGVTAGIDFALVLLAELAGRDHAEGVQLGLEYAPAPPFDRGRPELARPEVLARVKAPMARAADSRMEAALEAADRASSVQA